MGAAGQDSGFLTEQAWYIIITQCPDHKMVPIFG